MIYGWIILFIDLVRLPFRWKAQLSRRSLMELIESIEKDAPNAGKLKISPALILASVRYRVKYTLRWKNNRCLLSSLLLYHLLPRSGICVTINFGCKLNHNQLFAHSWIESPDIGNLASFGDRFGNEVVLSRSIESCKSGNAKGGR